MSKRLQVVLDDQELKAIQHIARRHRMTVSEWVRQILRAARREEPRVDAGRKLDVLRAAVKASFPTVGMEEMLQEIERGYLQSPST